MRLVFDIEGNNLLQDCTVVHCLCAIDADSKEKHAFRPKYILEGLKLLDEAEEITGHNILSYDLPVLDKLYGWSPSPYTKIVDTHVQSRVCFPDLKRNDWDDISVGRLKAKGMIGVHSLEAWGIRLGLAKGDFGKQEITEEGVTVWDAFSEEMLLYCMQDVVLNDVLKSHLAAIGCSEEALDMEQRFFAIAEKMSRRGFTFDVVKAVELKRELEGEAQVREAGLQKLFPGRSEQMKTPAYWVVKWPDGTVEQFATKGEAERERKRRKIRPAHVVLKKGPPRIKVHEFNPNSRKQIAAKLHEVYGWQSPELTDKGVELLGSGEATFEELILQFPKIDEDVLKAAETSIPVADQLIDFMTIKKRLGQVSDGANAWLKKFNDQTGRIHHRMITIGCATFRCSHSNPNLGQVPAVAIGKDGKPIMGLEGGYGWECRSLFTPQNGFHQVGIDLAGIEARMLAHFLAPFDGGAYVDHVLNGDIHSLNVDAIQKQAEYDISRSDSKPVFYGYMYGAGDMKLGRQLVSCSTAALQEFERLREYYTRFPDKITGHKYVNGQKTKVNAEERSYANIGYKVRNALESGIDGLGMLVEAVKERAKSRGYLEPLDGRRIPTRSPHSALNTLLQGTAAVVLKQWTVLTWEEVERRNMDAHLLVCVHDEHQAEVHPKAVDEYCELSLSRIVKAGEHYNLAIPLTGEAKIGNSWAECH